MPDPTPRPSYEERLWVPRWWWPAAAGLVLLLGAEFHVGLPLVVKVLTYAVFGGVAAFLLIFTGGVRIAVVDRALIAGRATLPLRYAGEVRVLDRPAMRRLIGPDADPAAWMVTRSWVGSGVAVVVDDPADDTPYWLLSSRSPEALAAAISAARSAG